jgi:hypothetical protein
MSQGAQSEIQVDDHGVRRHLPNGKVEQVAWRDLAEVAIVTTDEGPFMEDAYFVLQAADGSGCVVPSGAEASRALRERLQRLAGFDNERVIEAMTTATNGRFVCWRRANTPCSS